MKTRFSTLLVTAGLATSFLAAPTPATAQEEEAATRPLGYMTLTAPEDDFILLTAPLSGETLWQGPATGSTATTITGAAGSWTADYSDKLVMIKKSSGDAQGRVYMVESNTETELTIAGGGVNSLVADEDTIEIFTPSTLSTLLPDGGGLGAGDTLFLWDGEGSAWVPHTYSSAFGVWTVEGEDASNVVIYPGEGFFIRNSGDAVEIVIDGNVPDEPISLLIPGQSSRIASNPYPHEISLVETGLQNLPNWSDSDAIFLWRIVNADQSGEPDYVPQYGWVRASYSSAFGVWVIDGEDATNEKIAAGEAFFVIRNSDGGDWTNSLNLPYNLN